MRFHRVKTSAQFREITKNGKRINGRFITAYFLFNNLNTENYAGNYAGFVLSRAVGNAVTRNLYKRRLGGILRELPEPKTAVKVVIRARHNIAFSDYAQLKLDVESVFDRAVSHA